MGVQGLLPLLKSIMVPIHIKELEGCSVAVDTYSWLHKGALSCSTELCKGLPTSRHIDYCMHRVNLLRHHGVKPILVFDGGLLPMKMEQENKRARARKENLARALEHEANGNSAAAYECYQKAVDISPSIAHELIQVLKQENVSYVVAPYEADAQMTFLAVTKQVEVVITEDSDLIPFGCPRIIFKMDKFGHGVQFQASMLQKNKELSFSGFSKQMLLEMCILSGCDYLQSLSGMGLKRSHALITRFKCYDKVIKHLKYSTVSVPPLYEESFKKAILTFKHQRVYDPKTEDIVHLFDICDGLGDDTDFLGPLIPQHIAKGIAEGNLDPFTQMLFQGESVTPKLAVSDNSQPKSSKPESLKKKLDLPVQKNLLTKYFCFASLEAKRKFRAPRISRKCTSPTDDSSNTPEEQVNMEAASSEANDSFASSSHSENLGENGSANNDDPDNLESADHDGTVGSHDHKDVREEVERKTKMESVKTVVRSKYFQHKQGKGSCQDNIEEKPCLKDCSFIGKKYDDKTVIKESEACREKESRKTVVESPYLQHKNACENHEYDKCENLFIKDVEDGKNVIGEFEAMTKRESRQITGRSKYFQEKQSTKNRLSDEEEDLFVMDVSAIDTFENATPQIVSPGNGYFESTTGKRKSFLDDDLEKENLNSKRMRKYETSLGNGCCEPNLGETSAETNSEAKFGSNISHINRYSEIAEKSVERFVSVVRSFRYSSSGSHASGLRAPLKDVRNTCPNGSSSKLDLAQFTYAPNNRITAVRSRRL